MLNPISLLLTIAEIIGVVMSCRPSTDSWTMDMHPSVDYHSEQWLAYLEQQLILNLPPQQKGRDLGSGSVWCVVVVLVVAHRFLN